VEYEKRFTERLVGVQEIVQEIGSDSRKRFIVSLMHALFCRMDGFQGIFEKMERSPHEKEK
jgi:hypothetical protein